MPRFLVKHRTTYRYRRPVHFGEHRLMFRPRDSYDQRLLEANVRIDPDPGDIQWVHDVFGNCVTVVRPDKPSDRLSFETEILVEHAPEENPDFRISRTALNYPFVYDGEELKDLAPTIRRHYPDPNDEIGKWARQFLHAGKTTPTGALLMTLCNAIRELLSYNRRTEPGTQPPLTTLGQRRGTCRDFALLMIEAVRALGLAARFVTGYIYVPSRADSANLGGGSTHAWCQVYLPGAGWVEFDPTNGIVGNRDLIRVGVARHPSQAIPLFGTYDGKAADFLDMEVQVNVNVQAAPGPAIA